MGRKYWQKLTEKEIQERIFEALSQNVDYEKQTVLGVPASYLDDKVFHQDATFLQDAPFLSALIQNPNHIGCHTLGSSEPFFKGSQEIEREVIEICASEILNGQYHQQDGYVASGGTEANMQAIWIYRNYFIREQHAKFDEICILCSQDSHYSLNKAANILHLDLAKIPVQPENRRLNSEKIAASIKREKENGKKYFIVVVNMMTTMFGSVDNIDRIVHELEEANCDYKIHVDGAYGGFYYPFAVDENKLSFGNPKVSSVTLDAHKMVQAPYGTGIFLIRKGYMQYAITEEASYVAGQDYTLIGSRSGANAISIWMILMKNGPFGWREKIYILQKRAEWLCEKLEKLEIDYYRHPMSNIITIEEKYISPNVAHEFGLVPDDHQNPKWYKIVVMDHVTIEKLIPLINKLGGQ
jgi:glutamate/tyrosine decarboxylase-like PLP-dependent enzyme